MTGEIDVADILLGSVPSLAAPNHTLTLSGRAAVAAGAQVTIQADTGTGFVPVTTATVVLQLNLRERFGWWPVQQKTLDRSSRASFLVRPPYRAPARVVLTLPDGATPLAVSKSQRITP
jgi:hypothetical protein